MRREKGGQPPLSIAPRVDNPDIIPIYPSPLPHVTTTPILYSTYTILDNHINHIKQCQTIQWQIS
jgi:hypothetical protein